MASEPWFHVAGGAGIFLLSLLSEDTATLTAAVLAGLGKLSWLLAFAACFLGIWIGDLGLYGLARCFGRPVLNALLLRGESGKLARSEEWFARHGWWALFVCRFIPGTRLPTFLAAGVLRMPPGRFALITGVLAGGWVILIFALFHWLGALSNADFEATAASRVGLAALILLLVGLTRSHWLRAARRVAQSAVIQRWIKWEFWPGWLFYVPVGLNYLRLAAKYGGLSLPTCANPGIFTGGLIGESKQEILNSLAQKSAEWVAPSFLINEGDAEERIWMLEQGMTLIGSDFPIVLKPDVAQRGSGFKVVRDSAEAKDYLRAVGVPVVAQQYIIGPHEAGLFYYRFPSQSHGKIFAITEKIFPRVVGDGIQTVEQLIRADARAAMLAGTYLRRLDRLRDRILENGRVLRLVEAGNHAQGCIFRDGIRLWSSELEARIDAISKDLPGFFIGRYDVRFSSLEEFRAGRGFKILELNGAASEATSAYDASKPLREAYGILFQQWELVFAIAAENRLRGCRPESPARILLEWQRYRRDSLCHPLAD